MYEVKQVMKDASIAIHTMQDEHFGIGIVELLSAGLVVIAHNSAGPKYDILMNRNNSQEKFGFLANTTQDFANIMHDQLSKISNPQDRQNQIDMIRKGQEYCQKSFSNESCQNTFIQAINE